MRRNRGKSHVYEFSVTDSSYIKNQYGVGVRPVSINRGSDLFWFNTLHISASYV